MKTYKENDTVIYTDNEGRRIDTFAVFDTDTKTGLTHINHQNLKVDGSSLELHPRMSLGNTLPFDDSTSFILFDNLKKKYSHLDKRKATVSALALNGDKNAVASLARAS